jgi:hypothetical protein
VDCIYLDKEGIQWHISEHVNEPLGSIK